MNGLRHDGPLGFAKQMFGGDMGWQSLVSKSFQPMDFRTTAINMLQQPLLPWGILLAILIGVALSQIGKVVPDDPIDRMKTLFGVKNVPHWLAAFFALLWIGLVLLLVVGLVSLLSEIVWDTPPPEKSDKKAEFRFLLTKTTALTAVLGALVALPFTALRLKLSTEQNRHNQDVLYNEKLHNAITDLHARYQKTVPVRNGRGHETHARETIWEDDIIRRVGAIDRLQALVEERHEEAPRIARTLCVYLKEMTREHPAVPYPEDQSEESLEVWREKVAANKRADMEAAAQVLGRLPRILSLNPEFDKDRYRSLDVNLSGTNLQGMDLNRLDFSHAIIESAALDRAMLFSTWFDYAFLHTTRFIEASLRLAGFFEADLMLAVLFRAKCDHASFVGASLSGAYLDGAWLYGTKLHRTKLDGVDLEGTLIEDAIFDEHTNLNVVNSSGAALKSLSLDTLSDLEDLLEGAFGDASVMLPDEYQYLVADKWPDTVLNFTRFHLEWDKFKKDPASYIPPQLRDAKT